MTFSPSITDPAAILKRASALADRLRNSETYRECESAVRSLTGLRLQIESSDGGFSDPFFGIPALSNVVERHPSLLATAEKRRAESQSSPNEANPAGESSTGGLYEATVPLRIGTERIGVLRIGQTLIRRADAEGVSEFSDAWFGTARLPDEVRLAIMQLPVMSSENWKAAVWLLHRVAAFLGSEGIHVVVSESDLEPEPVARARSYIAGHFLEESLSLPRIAEAVGVTPNYLSHVYRKHTSLSVTESINRLRIEHSLMALDQGGQRISEVARSCGFGSLSQFNRSFRRFVGVSPTVYKRTGTSA